MKETSVRKHRPGTYGFMLSLPSRVRRGTLNRSADLAEFIKLKASLARRPGVPISFCTVVMDRFEHLSMTFLQNIEDNSTYADCEFVLLNYSCPDERTDTWAATGLLPYIESGRVNYYHYPDAVRFNRSHARNLAFRLARGEILCNVDADNYLGRHFSNYIAAALSRDGVFLRGPRDGRGLAGRICVRRTDFENVSGFDERFRGWGSEDGDLCNRLMMTGLSMRSFRLKRFCRSIPHGDDLRIAHHDMDTRTSSEYNTRLKQANLANRTLRPNGSAFGRGRVQVNFRDWIVLT